MKKLIPYSITDEGALVVWPGDLEDLVFAPALSRELADAVHAMVEAAVSERRKWLAAEEAAAKVIDLDTYRRRSSRATEHGPTPRVAR